MKGIGTEHKSQGKKMVKAGEESECRARAALPKSDLLCSTPPSAAARIWFCGILQKE